MRKINGVPTEASTKLSSLSGGEVLKWDASTGNMTWEDQDAFALTPFTFQGSNYGYSLGGDGSANNIEKFAFASAGNASNVADLTRSVNSIAGTLSVTHGYSIGGASSNVIDRFTFAADANSADVANLTVARYGPAGISAIAYGYAMGGGEPTTNIIEKFNFSSGADATDVGDITQVRRGIGGCQI